MPWPFPPSTTILILTGGYQAIVGVLRLAGIAPLLTPMQEVVVGLATVASGLVLQGILAYLKSSERKE
jgi:hypothetical protein